jgi:hypothetical protein
MIIIRKPKFMRSDAGMAARLEVAKAQAIIAENTLKDEDKLYWFGEVGKSITKAAKLGGFFSVRDMCKYLDQQKLKSERS